MGCAESNPLRQRKSTSEVQPEKHPPQCTAAIPPVSGNMNVANQNVEIIEFPLNERDIIAIMRSWKGVQVNIIETGLLVFLRMFEQSPEAKAVFEKFRSNETASAMYKHKDVLQGHGLVVMNAIDEVISNLDDLDTVYDLLSEQGRSHARFTDLTEKIFWAIEKPFMLAVKDALGDHFSVNIERLYILTIKFILDNIVVSFHAAKDEARAIEMSKQPV